MASFYFWCHWLIWNSTINQSMEINDFVYCVESFFLFICSFVDNSYFRYIRNSTIKNCFSLKYILRFSALTNFTNMTFSILFSFYFFIRFLDPRIKTIIMVDVIWMQKKLYPWATTTTETTTISVSKKKAAKKKKKEKRKEIRSRFRRSKTCTCIRYFFFLFEISDRPINWQQQQQQNTK